MEARKVNKWEDIGLRGSKRTNIFKSELLGDWFFGFGKDEGCQFEGTWWDMICFARNILASENTKKAAPEFYMPELEDWENYTGENKPYEFVGD